MGKTGDTKNRILELLTQKNVTLTDISKRLNLAPSTVSQHLQELEDAGMIKEVDDKPRKWKYYEINRGYRMIENQNRPQLKRIIIPVTIVLVIIALTVVFYTPNGSAYATAQRVYLAPGSTAPTGTTVFTVSDSPQFYNISALFITVTNASIHSQSTGKWYTIPLQTSTFNLVRLRNISAVLSGVKLSAGIYDELVLHISNVTVVVNGTNESAVLPSSALRVFGEFNLSNTTNSTAWINLDFDLAHSLHITGDGKVIMLPVLVVRHTNSTRLAINESSIVVARGPSHIKAIIEAGMDYNGSMKGNFSVPQNIGMSVNSNGSIREHGKGIVPIVVRGEHSLVIGGDVSELLNASSGIAANISAQVHRPNGMLLTRGCSELARGSINTSNATATISSCCPWVFLNSSIETAQPSGIEIGIGSFPLIRACCLVIESNSNLTNSSWAKRCMRAGIEVNASQNGSTGAGRPMIPLYTNNSDYFNTTLNGTAIPISIFIHNESNPSLGGFGACSLQDGALYCTSSASISPKDMAVRIDSGFQKVYGTTIIPISTNTSNSNSASNSTSAQVVNIQNHYLTMRAGEWGQVSLPVNPSTGTSWWVQSASPGVEVNSSSGVNTSYTCTPQMVGCSNQLTIYSFRASAPGSYTVELRLGHAWSQSEYYRADMVYLTMQNSTVTP